MKIFTFFFTHNPFPLPLLLLPLIHQYKITLFSYLLQPTLSLPLKRSYSTLSPLDPLPLPSCYQLLETLDILFMIFGWVENCKLKKKKKRVGRREKGDTPSLIFKFSCLKSNPRLFGTWIDLKYFCELRPGMFLWLVLNYAYAARQFILGGGGGVENAMVFVLVGQFVYVADSVWFESAILTTMDITTDGFG